ncbi:MAG TPA: tetratricopeptide repeat protein [Polyangia bacterium]|nr:tetratricopeptide repeat protein [Polyangia bacterium]
MTETFEATIEQAMERGLALQREGELDAADEIYQQILEHEPGHADAWHFRGLLALSRGKKEEALGLIGKAIEAAPEYADAHNNRGNVLFLLERYREALEAWRRAVEIRPDLAEAHFNLGRGFAAIDDVDQALAAFRRGLELYPEKKPEQLDAYRRMASLLYSADRVEEAAHVYREWLALEPDNDYAKHMLASCTQQDVPERASDSFVRRVFNGFAKDFDEQLQRLQYQAPKLVAEGLKRVLGPPAGTLEVLDAGCGTGLCGPGLKPYARRLVGVDLSSEMVKRAEGRGLYDELAVEELTAFLTGHREGYDLIASGDTVCYFGELGPLMAAAAAALRPGGHLVFTVERSTGDPIHLNPHGRYSHTDVYVREALAGAGMTTVMIAAVFLRMEAKKPVAGLLVVARR